VHSLAKRDLFSKRSWNKLGVTPVVSTILVLMIMFMAITVLLSWGIPYIEKLKAESTSEYIYSQFDLWDDGLRDLVIEGINSTRINNFVFDVGNLAFDQEGRRLAIYCFEEPGYDFFVYNFTDVSFQIMVNSTSLPNSIVRADIYWPNYNHRHEYGIKNYNGIKNYEENDTITIGSTANEHELTDVYYITFFYRIGNNNITVANCWVFDLGLLKWDVPTSTGTYSVKIENNGITTNTPNQEYFLKGNIIYNSSDQLYMAISLIRGRNFEGSNGITYRIISSLSESSVLKTNDECYNVTIFIDGENIDSWKDYFEYYGFKDVNVNGFENTVRVYDETRFTFLKILFNCKIMPGKGG
jgi:hypothetical protein